MLEQLMGLARRQDWLSERVGRMVSWLLLALVLLGAGNALLRYGGRHLGISWSSNALLEAQWMLFGLVFLLSGADTLRRNAHVRVDIIFERFSPRVRAAVNVGGHLLLLVPFSALLVWLSIGPVLDSWRRAEGSPDPGGLARYPIKTVVPIAFTLLLLQSLAEVVKAIAAMRVRPENGSVSGSAGEPLP